LIKPQAWSKNSEATVLEFQSLVNRTGYYEFETKQVGKRQIPSGKVAKVFFYPNAQQTGDIVKPEDRQSLQVMVDEIKGITNEFPASVTYVQPCLKDVQGELAKYDSGNVKINGQWTPATNYLAGKANNLVSQLKSDIVRSTSDTPVDLSNDPRFIALKDLAKANPKLNSAVKEIYDLQQKQLRFQQRAVIITKIGGTGVTLADAEPLVAKLKSLKPEEDPKSAAFVKAWDTSVVSADKISQQAAPVVQSLETEMAAITVQDAPPALSHDLSNQISSLNGTISLFIATSPPPQILGKIRPARAMCLINSDLPKLNASFEHKQFLEAKETLNELSQDASSIGPSTEKVLAALQRYTADQIDSFSKAREEAKLLADSGKKPEALAKYEAAFEIIPDSAVGDQIAQLKEEVPPAPSKK